MEEWRDIVGYEDFYQISNYGNVRSVDRTDSAGKKQRGKMRRTNDGYAIDGKYRPASGKVYRYVIDGRNKRDAHTIGFYV